MGEVMRPIYAAGAEPCKPGDARETGSAQILAVRPAALDFARRASLFRDTMTSPTPFSGLSDIGQIAITVGDVAKATAFYRDVLGLKFLFSAGPNLAFFAAGNVRIMLSTPQGAGEVGKNSILYFKVSDLTAAHAAIVARGAKNENDPHLVAKMPDHDLWLSAVRDPEGNIIELMSEVRPPRA